MEFLSTCLHFFQPNALYLCVCLATGLFKLRLILFCTWSSHSVYCWLNVAVVQEFHEGGVQAGNEPTFRGMHWNRCPDECVGMRTCVNLCAGLCVHVHTCMHTCVQRRAVPCRAVSRLAPPCHAAPCHMCACMRGCVRMYAWACLRVCAHLCLSKLGGEFTPVCVRMCAWGIVCGHTGLPTAIFVFARAHMCACVRVCARVRACVYWAGIGLGLLH